MSELFIKEPSSEFNTQLVAGSVKKAMDAAGAKSRDLWQVPLDKIRVLPEFNVRLRTESYMAHMNTIARSIHKEGFYQHKPLDGYVANEDGENVIYLTGGYTRYEAAGIAISKGAEIKTLPVVINAQGTSREDLVAALFKANKARELLPYETAIVCKRMMNYGCDVSEIAATLDIVPTYVEDLLLLIGGPLEIREMVIADQVAATTAIQALRRHGGKAVEHLQTGLARAKAAGSNRVTGKHLPGQVFKKKITKSAPVIYASLKDVKTDPGYVHLSESLREKLDELLLHLEKAEKEAASTKESVGESRASE